MQLPESQGAGASDPSEPFPHGIPWRGKSCNPVAAAEPEQWQRQHPAPTQHPQVWAQQVQLHKQLKVFGKVLLPGTGRSVLSLHSHASSPKTSTTTAIVAATCSHLPAPPRPWGESVSCHTEGKAGSTMAVRHQDVPAPPLLCCCCFAANASFPHGQLPFSVHHTAHHTSPRWQRHMKDKGAAQQNLLH